jgi:hypothetical protein
MVPSQECMADEERSRENFHQKLFGSIRRMNLTMVQADAQSMCMAFRSLRKALRQQSIHNMSQEVLGVEVPQGGIISTM